MPFAAGAPVPFARTRGRGAALEWWRVTYWRRGEEWHVLKYYFTEAEARALADDLRQVPTVVSVKVERLQ